MIERGEGPEDGGSPSMGEGLWCMSPRWEGSRAKFPRGCREELGEEGEEAWVWGG